MRLAEMKQRASLVAEIDEAELACRIVEASGNMKRPPGLTARQALATMEPEDQASCRRAARAVMEYWRECIDAGKAPS